MLKCKLCALTFEGQRTLAKYVCHWRQKHPGRFDYRADLECDVNDLSFDEKRRLKMKLAHGACTQCGFDKVRVDGTSVLQIDHVDGDSSNNDWENLRVLCPNCHALTLTYGPRNKKKGRIKIRSERLKERKQRDVDFAALVLSLHGKNVIDFSQFGWVQQLADLLDEIPQVVGRRVRKVLPDFYDEKCFRRGWRDPKYKKLHADVA